MNMNMNADMNMNNHKHNNDTDSDENSDIGLDIEPDAFTGNLPMRQITRIARLVGLGSTSSLSSTTSSVPVPQHSRLTLITTTPRPTATPISPPMAVTTPSIVFRNQNQIPLPLPPP